MHPFGKLLALVFILSVLSTCNDDQLKLGDDITTSTEEREIMDDCQDNTLNSVDEISNNLAGEWCLIGYACGFCAPHDPPSATITFTGPTGVLTYEDDWETTTLDFTWGIRPDTTSQGIQYSLETEPFHNALNLTNFCEDYMFYNRTFQDGTMFIYQKQ
ncbi:MAG: hypothetical protein AAF242_00375 [Bacteroidota bacterium]